MARFQIFLGLLAFASVWVGFTKMPVAMKVRPFELVELRFLEEVKKKNLSVPAEIEVVRRESISAAEELYLQEQSMISDSWEFLSRSLLVFGVCSLAAGIWGELKKSRSLRVLLRRSAQRDPG
jgi:hypothetical protein